MYISRCQGRLASTSSHQDCRRAASCHTAALSVVYREAASSAERRSAAYLRAACFAGAARLCSEYNRQVFVAVPECRTSSCGFASRAALQAYQRMKADSEWDQLEEACTKEHPKARRQHFFYISRLHFTKGEGHLQVYCFVAVVDADPDDPVAAPLSAETAPSCKLPAATAHGLPQLVAGTLDLNLGGFSHASVV